MGPPVCAERAAYGQSKKDISKEPVPRQAVLGAIDEHPTVILNRVGSSVPWFGGSRQCLVVTHDEDFTDAERAENTRDQGKAGLLQRMGKDLPHKLHRGVR